MYGFKSISSICFIHGGTLDKSVKMQTPVGLETQTKFMVKNLTRNIVLLNVHLFIYIFSMY